MNRIFTHTIFSGPVESGLLKMLAIGLGKGDSAAAAHRAAITRGLGAVVLEIEEGPFEMVFDGDGNLPPME